jgi:hypothetical protein
VAGISHNRVIVECTCGQEADWEDGPRWERDAEDDGWEVEDAADYVRCPDCRLNDEDDD